MGGGDGSMGRCWWAGEATAVHRCSPCYQDVPHLPPLIGRWPQMRDDSMACVCVFSCLSQPLAGTSVTSWPGALLRAEAESNTLMGGTAIVTDLVVIKALRAISLGYANRHILLQIGQGKGKKLLKHRLMLFTRKSFNESNSKVLLGINCVTIPY